MTCWFAFGCIASKYFFKYAQVVKLAYTTDLNAEINIIKKSGELHRLQPVEDKESQTMFGCPTKQEENNNF